MPPEPYRKRVRHFEGRGHLHELTISCYRRLPLLTNDVWQAILASSLSSACAEERFDLVAFVFMPEHVHLLVHPSSFDAKVSRLLARTKQPTSKTIKLLLLESQAPLLDRLMVQERPGKTCFRFWQEGPGSDRNLFSPQAIEASIEYIHTKDRETWVV
jgi:putative transposase